MAPATTHPPARSAPPGRPAVHREDHDDHETPDAGRPDRPDGVIRRGLRPVGAGLHGLRRIDTVGPTDHHDGTRYDDVGGGQDGDDGPGRHLRELCTSPGGPRLGVADRSIASSADPRLAAVQALVSGPTATEAAAGLGTWIPPGTAVRGLQVRDGVATVNFSPQFAAAGPPADLSARLAQVGLHADRLPRTSNG